MSAKVFLDLELLNKSDVRVFYGEICLTMALVSAGLRHVGTRYRVRFGAPVSKFSAAREGGGD
jgi:hypothetical protein